MLIYLDNNATTRPLDSVIEAVSRHMSDGWGNPSSAYGLGREARKAVDAARSAIASMAGALPEQVIFTSGATESINVAFHSATAKAGARRRIVVSAAEHSAVLAASRSKADLGFEVVFVPVEANGTVDVLALRAAVNSDTALVSVMRANNETGTVSPVASISKVCREVGALFHCDAAQAAGRIEIHELAEICDYVTVSGHKMHGPKGVGALVVGVDAPYFPLLFGGGQETGRRGGTENVPAIAGFGVAARAAVEGLLERATDVSRMRDELEIRVLHGVPGASVNGAGAQRLPNTTNIRFRGVDSDTLVAALDARGICVSSGSACLADSPTPSHVILAMTGSYEAASESIRFSLSRFNTMAEVEDCTVQVAATVEHLRGHGR